MEDGDPRRLATDTTLTCGFEASTICGWTQGASYNWTRITGPTPTNNTV